MCPDASTEATVLTVPFWLPPPQSFYKGCKLQAKLWADAKRQKLLAEGPQNRLNPLPTSPEPFRRDSNACEPLTPCTLCGLPRRAPSAAMLIVCALHCHRLEKPRSGRAGTHGFLCLIPCTAAVLARCLYMVLVLIVVGTLQVQIALFGFRDLNDFPIKDDAVSIPLPTINEPLSDYAPRCPNPNLRSVDRVENTNP